MNSRRLLNRWLGAMTWAALLAAPVGTAAAESAPDLGRPFEPKPISEPLYGVQTPSEDPARQRHIITAADGVKLYTETWLPKAKNGHLPPSRLPTVLVMSPYLQQGVVGDATKTAFETLVPRGYAFTQMHVRGTGRSGGCLERTGSKEVDDGARAIEYLGRDAPWSDGRVGAYGISYYGGTPLASAGRGDPRMTRYLKAMFIGGPVTNWYDLVAMDGVPFFLLESAAHSQFLVEHTLNPAQGGSGLIAHLPQKLPCQPANFASGVDQSGDHTPYYEDREHRVAANRIEAATFVFQGLADDNVLPLEQVGFFDRLPRSTPKAGMFGIFNHDIPDGSYAEPPYTPEEWQRPDFADMLVAWFDRYLKKLPTGVEDWPVAQLQGTDGQWRAERDWPATGGPAGQLGLGAGRLGAVEPNGSTSYTEGSFDPKQGRPPGTFATFETARLPERLQLTGQPVLDVWVSLDKPDAHLAARLEALDADGRPINHAFTIGLRSMRHLDSLVGNRFAQAHGTPPPVGVPVRVPLRFQPAELVVPKGGTLRLTLAGSQIVRGGIEELTGAPVSVFEDPSALSGSATRVTVLHNCAHPSALRFLMPRARPDLLNVRENDEPAGQPLADNRPFDAPVSTGGIARRKLCGQGPVNPQSGL